MEDDKLYHALSLLGVDLNSIINQQMQRKDILLRLVLMAKLM